VTRQKLQQRDSFHFYRSPDNLLWSLRSYLPPADPVQHSVENEGSLTRSIGVLPELSSILIRVCATVFSHFVVIFSTF